MKKFLFIFYFLFLLYSETCHIVDSSRSFLFFISAILFFVISSPLLPILCHASSHPSRFTIFILNCLSVLFVCSPSLLVHYTTLLFVPYSLLSIPCFLFLSCVCSCVFLYVGPDVPGEGEHKVMDMIRSFSEKVRTAFSFYIHSSNLQNI